MDTKRDIYNLWVQFTTKNDESYFRQFVESFVEIWRGQLDIDLNSAECVLWHEVRPDSGPHLARLPDEMLPAIGKFIIISRDATECRALSSEEIRELSILVDCLKIVCRNFDNILAVIKYEYKSNLIAILTHVFNQCLQQSHASVEAKQLFYSFTQFLEVLYDPYLTWRSFLRAHFADYQQLSYKPHNVHVEIVPFIYDCLQNDEVFKFPEIGVCLINALGAIICGSQHNGLRAICPATVAILMKILARWESDNKLRQFALKCVALMIIVLQKSSPEERQIDLNTIIQLYCDVMQQLLGSTHFCSQENSAFEISHDNEANDAILDVHALSATIDNIRIFLARNESANLICDVISDANLVDILISVPAKIKNWNLNIGNTLCSTLHALAVLAHNSPHIAQQMRCEKVNKLFVSLRSTAPQPNEQLLKACFHLAFNEDAQILMLPEVINKLLEWLPLMKEREQNFLADLLLHGCSSNNATKTVACEARTIKSVCLCLNKYENLTEYLIQNLIKLIEELGKLSITPIELKSIFNLLRKESEFPQAKQLQQTLLMISLQSMTNIDLCSQYFTFTDACDGILVPDIKNWTISGSYGFIFHILLKLNTTTKDASKLSNSKNDKTDEQRSNNRRMILNLRTAVNTGFEIFIQNNGNIVVAALTRREYLTSVVNTRTLLDGHWHYVTVVVTPPKRPFSYSQVNVFIDHMQKLSAQVKMQAISEPFTYCSIGAAMPAIKEAESANLANTAASDASGAYKRMLPSLLERTISKNVSNYFTLPLRTQTSFDPNVKNFPIGMQETVFGEQITLDGHVGGVLMAEPTTNLKTIFDAGSNFANIFSQDNELLEMIARFVFCYTPRASCINTCQDLIPNGRFLGIVKAQNCRIIKIQDTINSIGGILAILPILHSIIKQQESIQVLFSESTENEQCLDLSPNKRRSSNTDELADWELLGTHSYAEWKMIQCPVAGFLCFLRYLTHAHENNQENMLQTQSVPIVGMMLQKCPAQLFDVNALMATHLWIESLQAQSKSQELNNNNNTLLEELYAEIVFNFNIWSHMHFQITLGHVQYLSAMLKGDRKYYRRKYGVQFFLDVVRQHYSTPDQITPDDAKTIRATLYAIVRFYLQKDVNIKEIMCIISFLASVRQEELIIEIMELLTFHIKSKNCCDQLILLLHEPQTANLLYNYFIDKSYSSELQDTAIRFISCLLSTSRVHQKYKQTLRLCEQNSDNSLFPGFFSYTIPMTLSSTVILHLVDEMLNAEADYAGLMYLLQSISQCDLDIKLEIAKRLLQVIFVNPNATQQIVRHIGWQDSIARLLISRPIVNGDNERKKKNFDNKFEVSLDDEPTVFNNQTDLINFCEQQMELQQNEDAEGSTLLLDELQAQVTEAANVLESEIKVIAESVTEKVKDNVSSVFSVIRQTTHDIQDTFESLATGSLANESQEEDNERHRSKSVSSNSSSLSPALNSDKVELPKDLKALEIPVDNENAADMEEQLVYLVSNILFTLFWRGVSNDHPNCWKERGQVLGCINLLVLNNELMASHLTLRLRILEMAVQASLFDLAENGNQMVTNQENASQILRMVYDLVVLGSNEDELKKCSTQLLDGVLELLDALMIFQHDATDDWSDMIGVCLGLLLKCSSHPNPGVVAMATAKLHAILQSRNTENPNELAFLLYSINRALDNAIEFGNPEKYSFLMPVMKALLDKCRNVFNLDSNLPDLPPTSSGPVFFNEFQVYSTTKKWRQCMERVVKPLYDTYQWEIELTLWEPINRFWAECYEAYKTSAKSRSARQAENRLQFQSKIIMPWKVRQVEEITRLNAWAAQQKTKSSETKKLWKIAKRFLYGPRGPWFAG